ncbi:MAG: histidine--tRNA ligase, partial [Gammaproteobacteria bacterium]|nr:histidine--tRNA ligase [Gammaproteobacteria bacterium]
RLDNNPLRILDSKDSNTQALLDDGPSLSDFIDDESKAHFEQLCNILDRGGLNYQVNPRLVRGLDYYGKTVFEWVTDKLGAQGTICAGGRYDGLVSHLGGKPTPAVGFAIGLERLALLVEQLDLESEIDSTMDVYIMPLVPGAAAEAAALGEELRSKLPQLKVLNHCGGGSVKSQMKKADKSGARWALIIGDEEIQQNKIILKSLRSQEPQLNMTWDEIVSKLQSLKG